MGLKKHGRWCGEDKVAWITVMWVQDTLKRWDRRKVKVMNEWGWGGSWNLTTK